MSASYLTTNGPSLLLPHRHVKMTYVPSQVFGKDLSVSNDEFEQLSNVFHPNFFNRLNRNNSTEVSGFIREIVLGLQHLAGDLPLECRVHKRQDFVEITLAYANKAASKMMLSLALKLVLFIKRPSGQVLSEVRKETAFTINQIEAYSPNQVVINMIAACEEFNIPYNNISKTCAVVCYGQGSKGIFLHAGLSQFDSKIGFDLQVNKARCCRLIKALGYPVPVQHLVSNRGEARQACQALGFPVVIKPLSESKGLGVSANIKSLEDADAAFALARSTSDEPIIVESFIEGDDHRITISQGIVTGVIRRRAANVEGDGVNDIKTLIEQKNSLFEQGKGQGASTHRIDVDEAVRKTLASYSLNLQSVPDKGQIVEVRSNANASTGGELKIVELDEVHPDNLAMMLDIVQSFRLSSVGIDFITPDISRPWSEMGGIIEMNNYANQSERLARGLLLSYFGNNDNGRIKTTLVLSDDMGFQLKFVPDSDHSTTGYSNNTFTTLANLERKFDDESLSKRCYALLINIQCESLVVATSFAEIIKNGLPIDQFTDCIIDESYLNQNSLENLGADQITTWLAQYVSNPLSYRNAKELANINQDDEKI